MCAVTAEPSAPRINVRELYFAAVCLVTLIVSLFSAVSVARHAVELAYPDPYLSARPAAESVECPPEGSCVPAEQVKIDMQLQERSQRRYAVLGLVQNSVTLLITVPVFVLHWRRFGRVRSA